MGSDVTADNFCDWDCKCAKPDLVRIKPALYGCRKCRGTQFKQAEMAEVIADFMKRGGSAMILR